MDTIMMYDITSSIKSFKRSAPPTPQKKTAKKQRVSMPSPSPTPPRQSPCSHHRNFDKSRKSHVSLLTPRRIMKTPIVRGPDRYIPCRTSMSCIPKVVTNRDRVDCLSTKSYDDHLQRVLFGGKIDNRIMSFGNPKPKINGKFRIGDFSSPFSLDSLRNEILSCPIPSLSSSCKTTNTINHQQSKKINQTFALNAPGILPDEGLALISCGPLLAIALGDELYLYHEKRKSCKLVAAGSIITCVRWSNDGSFLAVASGQSVQIWSLQENKMINELIYPSDTDGHIDGSVTAIAWKGAEILTGTEEGNIYHYNLKERHPIASRCYEHPGYRVTCLAFDEGGIASIAFKDDRIHMIAPTFTNLSRSSRSMIHSNVTTVKFQCSRPHVLISGGERGIKFWDVKNGVLLETLQIDSPVVSMVMSPFQNDEVAVAEKGRITVWKLDPIKSRKIKETIEMDRADLQFMDVNAEGQISCTHTDLCRLTGWDAFVQEKKERQPKYPLSTFGAVVR